MKEGNMWHKRLFLATRPVQSSLLPSISTFNLWTEKALHSDVIPMHPGSAVHDGVPHLSDSIPDVGPLTARHLWKTGDTEGSGGNAGSHGLPPECVPT